MMPNSAVTTVPPDSPDLAITSDQLCRALSHSGVPALRLVTVLEQEDMVILSGRLPSFYLKQLAQETVIPHLGDRHLENRITVVQH
ncbi:MAG: BON domain-containing protein [Planctomycetia bacterium]|nr:BON domain-containing protein [Planctomycetia bacterium]